MEVYLETLTSIWTAGNKGVPRTNYLDSLELVVFSENLIKTFRRRKAQHLSLRQTKVLVSTKAAELFETLRELRVSGLGNEHSERRAQAANAAEAVLAHLLRLERAGV